MKAALMYTADNKGRLPGVAINDGNIASQLDAGTRRDYLSWFGTWKVYIKLADFPTSAAWANAPQGGRLWKYYRNPALLRCPSSEYFNGKLSYSTPENVAMAMSDPSGMRGGLPPQMENVKHPADAIQFLEEDEKWSLGTNAAASAQSYDDGFGEPDMFAGRHEGQANVAFFDGHAEPHYFPRGKKSGHVRTESANPFEAWMIQIAPFNSQYTPRPWKWDGDYAHYPKFKAPPASNYPTNPCRRPGPGCE